MMTTTIGYGKNALSDDHHIKFDLYCALNRPHADWFSAQLFRLIHKADPNNRNRLRAGYPDHVRVFEEWYTSEDEREFFREVALSDSLE
jgi:hypothetical protein